MWVLLRHLLATPKNADTKNPNMQQTQANNIKPL